MSYKTLLLTPENTLAPLPAGPEETPAGARYVSAYENNVTMYTPDAGLQLFAPGDVPAALSAGAQIINFDSNDAKAIKMWAPDDTLRAVQRDLVPQALAEGARFYDGTPLSAMPAPKNATAAAAKSADAGFALSNPDWIGPRTSRPLDQIEGGTAFLDIQSSNARGRAGAGEEFFDWGAKDIPFIGDVVGAAISFDMLRKLPDIAKRLQNNEPVADEELVAFNTYLADSKRHANASTSGQWGRGMREMLSFGSEFLLGGLAGGAIGSAFPVVGTLAGGVGGAVAGVARKAGAKIASKAAATAVKGAMEKIMGRAVAGTVETAAQSAVGKFVAEKGVETLVNRAVGMSALNLAAEASANILAGAPAMESRGAIERELSGVMAGEEITPEKARWLDLGDKAVEYLSEASGAALGAFASDWVGKPLRKLAGDTAAHTEWGARLGALLDKYGSGKGLSQGLRDVAGKTLDQVKQEATAAGKGAIGRTIAASGALAAKVAVKYGITADAAIETMKRMGYDGFLEEMGEERFGGFVRGLLGLEGDEAGIKNAFMQMVPTFDQFKQEVLLFATPIIGVSALHSIEASIGGDVDAFSKRLRDITENVTPHASVNVDVTNATPSGGSQPVTPANVASSQRAAEATPVDAVVAAVAEESDAELNAPKGWIGRVAKAVLRTTEGVLTQNPYVFQHSTMDRALAQQGHFRLVSFANGMWRQAYNKAVTELAAEQTLTAEKQAEIEAAAKARANAARTELVTRMVVQMRKTARVNAAVLSGYKGATPEETRANLEKAVQLGALVRHEDASAGVASWFLDRATLAKQDAELQEVVANYVKQSGITGAAIDEAVDVSDPESARHYTRMELSVEQIDALAKDPTAPDSIAIAMGLGLDIGADNFFEQVRERATLIRNAYERGVAKSGNKAATVSIVPARFLHGNAMELIDHISSGYAQGGQTMYVAAHEAAATPDDKAALEQAAVAALRGAAGRFRSVGKRKDGTTLYQILVGAANFGVSSAGDTILYSMGVHPIHLLEDVEESREARAGDDPRVGAFLDNLRSAVVARINPANREQSLRLQRVADLLSQQGTRAELTNKIFNQRLLGWDLARVSETLPMFNDVAALPEDLASVPGLADFIAAFEASFGLPIDEIVAKFKNPAISAADLKKRREGAKAADAAAKPAAAKPAAAKPAVKPAPNKPTPVGTGAPAAKQAAKAQTKTEDRDDLDFSAPAKPLTKMEGFGKPPAAGAAPKKPVAPAASPAPAAPAAAPQTSAAKPPAKGPLLGGRSLVRGAPGNGSTSGTAPKFSLAAWDEGKQRMSDYIHLHSPPDDSDEALQAWYASEHGEEIARIVGEFPGAVTEADAAEFEQWLVKSLKSAVKQADAEAAALASFQPSEAEQFEYDGDVQAAGVDDDFDTRQMQDSANALVTTAAAAAVDAQARQPEEINRDVESQAEEAGQDNTPTEMLIGISTTGKFKKSMQALRQYLGLIDRMYGVQGASFRSLYALAHTPGFMKRIQGAVASGTQFQAYLDTQGIDEQIDGATRRLSQQELVFKAVFRALAAKGVSADVLRHGANAIFRTFGSYYASEGTAAFMGRNGSWVFTRPNQYKGTAAHMADSVQKRVRSLSRAQAKQMRDEVLPLFSPESDPQLFSDWMARWFGIPVAVLRAFGTTDATGQAVFGAAAVKRAFASKFQFYFQPKMDKTNLGAYGIEGTSDKVFKERLAKFAESVFGKPRRIESKGRQVTLASVPEALARSVQIPGVSNPTARVAGRQQMGWLQSSATVDQAVSTVRAIAKAMGWNATRENAFTPFLGVSTEAGDFDWSNMIEASRTRFKRSAFLRQGLMFAGVFGDKDAALFFRLSEPGRPVSRAKLLPLLRALLDGSMADQLGREGYEAMYARMPKSVQDELMDPSRVRALLDEAAKSDDALFEATHALMRDLMDRTIAGDYANYVTADGRFDVNNLRKRMGSALTPGVTTAGLNPKVLLVDTAGMKIRSASGKERTLSDRLDGMSFFTDSYGQRYRSLLGPVLAKNNSSGPADPDHGTVMSIKPVLFWSMNHASGPHSPSFPEQDERTAGSVLLKMHLVNIKSLSGMAQRSSNVPAKDTGKIGWSFDGEFMSIEELAQRTGADWIVFRSSNKVAGKAFADRRAVVLSNSGALVGSALEDARAKVFEVPGERVYIPQYLETPLRFETARASKQGLLNQLLLPHADKVQILEDRLRAAILANLDTRSADWIRTNVIEPNREDPFLKDQIARIEEGGIPWDSPLLQDTIVEMQVRAAARALEAKEFRLRSLAVDAPNNPLPDLEWNEEAGRAALPWIAVNIRPTAARRLQTYKSLNSSGFPVGFESVEEAREYIRAALQAAVDAWRLAPADKKQDIFAQLPFVDLFPPVLEEDGRPAANDAAEGETNWAWDGGNRAPLGSPDIRLVDGQVQMDNVMWENIRQLPGIEGYTIAGSFVQDTRIPSESLVSHGMGRIATTVASNANFAVLPTDMREAEGGDLDGDAQFLKFLKSLYMRETGPVDLLGESTMNRRLILQAYGFTTDTATRWSRASVAPIVAEYKKVAKELRASSPNPASLMPLNSVGREAYLAKVIATGKRLLGIAAKTNIAHDLGIELRAHLRTPFSIVFNGKTYRLGFSAKELEESLSQNPDMRHMVKVANDAVAVNMNADDGKDPTVGYLGWNETTLSWFLTAMHHNAAFLAPSNGQFDFNTEAARMVEVGRDIMRSLATDPFVTSLVAAIEANRDPLLLPVGSKPPEDEVTGEKQWSRVAKTRSRIWRDAVLRELLAEVRSQGIADLNFAINAALSGKGDEAFQARVLQAQSLVEEWMKVPFNRGNRKHMQALRSRALPDVFLSDTTTKYGQWKQLSDIASDEFHLGTLVDLFTQDNAPKTPGDMFRSSESVSALSKSELLEVPGLSGDTPITRAVNNTLDQYRKAWEDRWQFGMEAQEVLLSERDEDGEVSTGERMPQADEINARLYRMERVLWARAADRIAPGATARIDQAAWVRMEPQLGALADVLDFTVDSSGYEGVMLKERYQDTPIPDSVLAAARKAFDALAPALQARLFANSVQAFGTSRGSQRRGYLSVLGTPGASAFDRTLHAAIEAQIKDQSLSPADVEYAAFGGPRQYFVGEKQVAEAPSPKVDLPASVPASGFLGYRGGFADKGKGTAAGDGKDQAMRVVANVFVGELAHRRASSTKTSALAIAGKTASEPFIGEKMFAGGDDPGSHRVLAGFDAVKGAGPLVVMLARNGELRGRPLDSDTVAAIRGLARQKEQSGRDVRFVVGDMPGVDSPFVDLLEQIGAPFEIYHTGPSARLTAKAPQTPGSRIPEEIREAMSKQHIVHGYRVGENGRTAKDPVRFPAGTTAFEMARQGARTETTRSGGTHDRPKVGDLQVIAESNKSDARLGLVRVTVAPYKANVADFNAYEGWGPEVWAKGNREFTQDHWFSYRFEYLGDLTASGVLTPVSRIVKPATTSTETGPAGQETRYSLAPASSLPGYTQQERRHVGKMIGKPVEKAVQYLQQVAGMAGWKARNALAWLLNEDAFVPATERMRVLAADKYSELLGDTPTESNAHEFMVLADALAERVATASPGLSRLLRALADPGYPMRVVLHEDIAHRRLRRSVTQFSPAWYQLDDHSIHLTAFSMGQGDLDLAMTVAHEALHAMTAHALRTDGQFKADMESLFEAAKAAAGDRGFYALSNLDEFIPGALTDPEFQRFLAQVPGILNRAPGATNDLMSDYLASATRAIGPAARGSLFAEALREVATNILDPTALEAAFESTNTEEPDLGLLEEVAADVGRAYEDVVETGDPVQYSLAGELINDMIRAKWDLPRIRTWVRAAPEQREALPPHVPAPLPQPGEGRILRSRTAGEAILHTVNWIGVENYGRRVEALADDLQKPRAEGRDPGTMGSHIATAKKLNAGFMSLLAAKDTFEEFDKYLEFWRSQSNKRIGKYGLQPPQMRLLREWARRNLPRDAQARDQARAFLAGGEGNPERFARGLSIASYDEFLQTLTPFKPTAREAAMDPLMQNASWLRATLGREAQDWDHWQKMHGLFDEDGLIRPIVQQSFKDPVTGASRGTPRFGKRLLSRNAPRLTKDERTSVKLFRWLIGAAVQKDPVILMPAGFDPTADYAKDFLPEDLLNELKVLAGTAKDPSSASAKDQKALAASGHARFWKSEDGKKIIEGRWALPVGSVARHWLASSARAKLVSAGRSQEDLDPSRLAKMIHDGDPELSMTALYGRVTGHLQRTMGDEAFLIAFRPDYLPLVYGHGFLGPQERMALLALENQIAKAEVQADVKYTEVMEAGKGRENGAPTSKMLRTLMALRGLDEPQSGTALEAVRAGKYDGRPNGIPTGASYSDVAQMIRDDILQRLTNRLIRGEKAITGALTVGGVTIEDPLGAVKALNKQIGGFRQREFSNRTKFRAYKNYTDAYEKAGVLPRTMDPFDLRHIYVGDLMTAMVNKSTVYRLLMQKSETGAPLYAAVPDLEYLEEGLLKPALWDAHYRQLAAHFNFAGDPRKTTKENLVDLVNQHIERKGDYTIVESPYPSVMRFHALKDTRAEGNVMDAMVGGQAAGILKHVTGLPMRDNLGILEGVEHANAWMKGNALGLSLFFAKSGLESVIAARGAPFATPWGAWKEMKSMHDLWKAIRAGDTTAINLIEDMEKAGIEISRTIQNEQGIGRVQKDANKMANWITLRYGEERGNQVRRALDLLTTAQSRFMFEDIFNTAKIFVALKMTTEAETKARLENKPFDRVEFLRGWAQTVNDSLGGQDWNAYSYMTPGMNQAMNLTLFSWNWTLSALNIAGLGVLTSRVFKNYVNPQQLRFILRNWVWMASLVLAAEPLVLQALVWALFPTDDGDEPLTWNNEEDRKFYADITPAIRVLNPDYKGDPTGTRRIYIRWGKQAYEITDGWLSDPQNQFLRKLSQPARLALEMATGKSPGSEWNLGFKDLGLRGLLEDKDGEFGGSRLSMVFQKFAPFSILQWASQPDARPAGLFGTTSKGMSFGKATAAFEGLLRAYAQDDTWRRLQQSPKMRHNLEALGPELLDAVTRNGYDASKIISAARGAALKDIYANAFEAINSQDEEKLHRVGQQILRLNGTVQTLMKSVAGRNQQYGQEAKLTPEQQAMIEQAFGK